jgi:uncharacterized protein (DUF2336 family)
MSATATFGLDVSVFEGVLAIGDDDARAALARQLAGLVCDAAASAIEISQVQPILVKLTVDPSLRVRQIMAEELAEAPHLDADVAFSIISDDDDIALPFLRRTRALDEAQLIAILKVGDEARGRAIASRPDITAVVADHIIRAGSLPAALALCDNASVGLEPNDCHALYLRFGGSPDMVERLLAKPDLPLDIRIIQARRAASRMRQMMAERGWITANDASELCSEAEDNALMQVLIEANPAERGKATAFMATKNMLTPALILRAAANGQMSVVEAALAHLTGNSQPRTAELMYSPNPANLKSMFRRSGLPASCYGILRAACDVVRDMREEGVALNAIEFGGRVLEALMTRYDAMTAGERAKQIEFLGRYGEMKIRKVAKRLKADLVRAA